MNDLQQTARAAIARAGRNEPTITLEGHAYPESLLLALQDSGRLADVLGDQAALAADFLRRVEWARRPTYGPPLRLITVHTDGATDPAYSVPSGWEHVHIEVTYTDSEGTDHGE